MTNIDPEFMMKIYLGAISIVLVCATVAYFWC